MEAPDYRYTYGPVPSRRLGRSLGVDLVPFKTCTFDCIYCQLGRTTNKTIQRDEYVPVIKVIQEIEKRLNGNSHIDYITLAGSGEPTLHSNIGEIIKEIKYLTSIPVAVITNGSLLSNSEVQDALMKADLIVPSLDAGSENVFKLINRPHKNLQFNSMVDGICEFRNRFRNNLWLEVFLVLNVNDTVPEVKNIASLVNKISPDKVQLNTVFRPPAGENCRPLSSENLTAVKEYFEVDTEIITDFAFGKSQYLSDSAIRKKEILTLLERRPCTAKNVADGLGIRVNEVVKQLDLLLEKEIETLRFGNDRLYYKRKRSQ